MNLARILEEQAQARPTAPAIIDTVKEHDRITSFGELQEQVTRAAALLRQAGLQPGDEVLVFQPMSKELYVALIALFRLGLVVMFIDPAAGIEHIERCCSLIPPKAFIGSPKAHVMRLLSPALWHIPRKFVIGAHLPGAIPWSDAARLEPYQEIDQTSPDAPALLTFTSGSTGQPKAALRTHSFLLAQHQMLEHTFGSEAGGVSLTTLPIFVLADLASGTASLIAAGNLRKPGSIAAGPVIQQIERYRPVRAGASPAFWERIVAYCRDHNRQLPHLRAIYAGGAPVFPRLLDDLQAIAPQAEIIAIYGSTEAEPIAHVSRSELRAEDIPAMLQGKGLLAGTPSPELQVRVVCNQWGKAQASYTAAAFDIACLPTGTPGEIVVSGAHVLPGYLHGQGDAETRFRVDGTLWCRTGDMGYFDAEGRLWLLGRSAARIEDWRGTLYPFTVECAVSAYLAVRHSAAAALHGQRILALEFAEHIQPPDIATIQQTVAWANFDAICVFKHLPMDNRHNAKIDYPALRRLLASRITCERKLTPGYKSAPQADLPAKRGRRVRRTAALD